ncbi:hypothetical protein MABM_26120 [Mycobacteroides abscessus]|nr:hypothetical protein MABM_26120 [Mycobacteroides abscessus]
MDRIHPSRRPFQTSYSLTRTCAVVSTDKPTHGQVVAKWLEVASGIDKMMERVGNPEDFAVAPGSPLFGDDRVSTPYQVSHAARMCLVSGVDHLHAAKSLVLDLKVLHASAVYSLLRGSLENLAAAFWILNPPQRNERIEHALRWHAKNFREQNIALEPCGLSDESSYQGKLAKLHAVASPRNISNQKVDAGFRSSTVVKYTEEQLPNVSPLLPWQVCSGFAHGRPWAVLGMSEQEHYETVAPGVMNVRLTSGLDRVLFPALSTFRLMVAVVDVLQRRAHVPS